MSSINICTSHHPEHNHMSLASYRSSSTHSSATAMNKQLSTKQYFISMIKWGENYVMFDHKNCNIVKIKFFTRKTVSVFIHCFLHFTEKPCFVSAQKDWLQVLQIFKLWGFTLISLVGMKVQKSIRIAFHQISINEPSIHWVFYTMELKHIGSFLFKPTV